MIAQFDEQNHAGFCDQLARKDIHLRSIIKQYGYPPVWVRPPRFASLLRIILEQQVSLASAKAAYNKLHSYIGTITPQKVLELSDTELRACYFSRQKTNYARALATAIHSKQLRLPDLSRMQDAEVRIELKKIKGIGDWTADIYLLFALRRSDVFPAGDLAVINAMKEVKQLPSNITKEKLIVLAEQWKPYRSVAAYLLWHYYIKSRKIKV